MLSPQNTDCFPIKQADRSSLVMQQFDNCSILKMCGLSLRKMVDIEGPLS
jgi:hypothetical protein